MASSTNGKMAIPFSLKLSAPKKIQKKLPDPKAIQKILEKVDPNKAVEKKDEQIKPEEKSEPAPVPAERPSESAAPLEGEDEPVSFSIGMARKRVSKLGKAAPPVRKPEPPPVRKPEPPLVTKPSLLPAPIEESWMNNDVEKVDPELRPSYNQKKSEKKKEKSDKDSDSASESKESKRHHKTHKSSHSKHKDRESRSHSSHSKHKSSDSKSHSKSSKSHSDSKSSKSHSDRKSDSKPPKRKFRPVHNPPPINFQDLLKMAEEKQAEGVKIVEPVIIPKKKPEERPRTQEEIDREARRKTKAYQDWLKYGGTRPPANLTHSPSQSNEDSNGSADLGQGMERSQSKFGRQAEARKPKHPPKPKVDQGKVLIDSLFSDAVHIGTIPAKKPPKPDKPERPLDRSLENSGASSKDRHNSRQDGCGNFPADRKSEKRSREDSSSRDSSEFSKRMKTNNHEHHSSHKHHNSHEHHNSHASHKHSSHEHHSSHRNQHENSSHNHHSSHGGHSSDRNGNHPDRKPSEQFRGVQGGSRSGSPAVMNGNKTKVMAAHGKSGDRSKDRSDGHDGRRPREHPVTGGKHLPQGASGSKPAPHPSSAGPGLSRAKETDSAGKIRPGPSSQGLRPPQVSRPGTSPALASRGASAEPRRPQQSAPRIIDCSPQSPPRKAPRPSGPPPPHMNPFDRIMGNMKKKHPKPVPKPRKRQVIESDEEDSSMDDFIVDEEEEDFRAPNISSVIKNIFRYDRTKYHDEDDDLRDMETSYSKLEAEERRSYRLGMKEDLEEERKEEMRKRQKLMMKKGYR